MKASRIDTCTPVCLHGAPAHYYAGRRPAHDRTAFYRLAAVNSSSFVSVGSVPSL